MARDPKAYPNPEEFKPERFLKDGALDPSVRDPQKYAFGFGRRYVPAPIDPHLTVHLRTSTTLWGAIENLGAALRLFDSMLVSAVLIALIADRRRCACAPRICPGRHVAENGMYIAFACVLATFNIEHAVDARGNRIPIEVKMTPQITLQL